MGGEEEDGSSKVQCMLQNGKKKGQPNLPIWLAFTLARFNEGVAR
jgi:hypothetical protein